jgi:hypothetical protein
MKRIRQKHKFCNNILNLDYSVHIKNSHRQFFSNDFLDVLLVTLKMLCVIYT